nr:reverse transcriptase domain-containing protein [Tanacetum cinerariifolium]
MRTRASNSGLVEPLPEPEHTLNQRVRRRNRRVPFEQKNNPPQNPIIVYPLILDINDFCHFLVTLQNLSPMDDEPMWAANPVVAPTLGSTITILEIANEFAIKELLRNCHGHNLSKGNIIKIFYHGLNETTQEVLNAAAGGIFLYKTPNQAYQLLEDKVLLKLDWAKNQKTKSSPKKTVAFAAESSTDLGASINLMPYSFYAKLSLETLKPTKMSIILADRSFQYPVGIAENMLVEIGSEIFQSIERTIFEEKLFAEFDEFMALTADESSESESDTEEPPFKKITFNADYKIKTSLEEPPTDLELKPLPDNLEYAFLEEPSFLPVIISSQLSKENKNK